MGTPIFKPGESLIISSERWDYGDTITYTRTYRSSWFYCAFYAMPKGTVGTGELDGFVVKQCTAERAEQGTGILSVVWEPTAAALPGWPSVPPPVAKYTPFELNPRVTSHPRYNSLTRDDFDNIDHWLHAADRKAAEQAFAPVYAKALALELADKLQRGTETYYLAGIRYDYTSFSWTTPSVTRGGFLTAAPTSLLTGLSCLRISDELEWTGSMWRLTQSWLCGPSGHWDSQLYS